MSNPESVQENENYKILRDFWIQTDHLISARLSDLVIVNKNKRTCRIVDFAVLADHRVKLKESEKRDKYLDFAKELKQLCNMKVTVISILIAPLGPVTKELVWGLEDLNIRGREETTQTTVLLISATILKRVLEICCHSYPC